MPAPSAYLVVPVFNEAENVPLLVKDLDVFVEQLHAAGFRPVPVFVDDGSTDGTRQLLSAAHLPEAVILGHDVNRGPGAAFRTAFSDLLQHGLAGDDLVITLEGDATSVPDVFARMLRRLGEGDDIVMASPYLYGGGFSEIRRGRVLISQVASACVKLALGVRGLATFSCFYRIHRGRALAELYRRYGPVPAFDGFECAVEVLAKAVRCRLTISEVPFRVDWSRRKGQSKMRLVKTSIGYIRLLMHLRRTQPRP